MQDGSEWRRDGEDSGVVPVKPVVRGMGLPTLPRTIVVAVIVGLVMFVAGLQLGGGRTGPVVTVVRPSVAATSSIPDESPAQDASPTPTPPIPPDPGTSDFSRSFKPNDTITSVKGGSACVTHDESSDALDIGIPVYVHSWSTYCTLKKADRAVFIRAVLDALSRTIAVSSASARFDDSGSMVALFSYDQPQLSGTVLLTAGAAGTGYEIVITLDERIAQ